MNILEQLQNTEPIIIVKYVLLVFGILLTIFNYIAIRRAKASQNWHITNGIILNSELEVHKSAGKSNSISYSPRIKYKYSIAGNEYTSKRIYFGGNIGSSTKKKKSQRLVDKYPKDSKVDVYYNPMKESMSVLQTGVKSEIITGLVFGVIFLLVGLVLAYKPDLIISIFPS